MMTSRQRLGWMKMKLLPDYYKTVFLNLILFFIVVQVQFSAFSPTSPHLALPTSLPCFHPPCYCPCVLYNCSCKPFNLFPCNPLPSPLWSLSACAQFQCLWLYFACLFIFLMRFLLKVRSYGICPLPPGLFHLV